MGWTFYNSSGEALTNFGPVALTDLDIDGGTDIGEAIVDADLFIIDNGAGGTNVKTTASRLKTYVNRVATGTYTGDGSTSQAITGIGFTPKYVRIYNTEADGNAAVLVQATDRQLDLSVESSPSAQLFQASGIIAFGSDGFTVDDDGDDGHPNTNSEGYEYLAIG